MPSRSTAVLGLGLLLCLFGKCFGSDGCDITLYYYYPNPGPESSLRQQANKGVNFTCKFSANCEINADFIHADLSTGDRHLVRSKYWAQRLYFLEKVTSNHLSTEVDATLEINSFTNFYAGNYWCRACDVSDSSNCIERLFTISIPPSDGFETRDCFLPMPENITVEYEVDESGNAVALVDWSRTSTTNELDTECSGGRVWKVGVANYGNDVLATPEDHMPLHPSKYVKWYNVPGKNMTYSIPNLNNRTYYMFVVSHRRDVLLESIAVESATSHVYYFGRQEAADIIHTPSSRTLRIGDYASITCEATGVPTPLVQWFSEGRDEVQSYSQATLNLNKVTHEDSGYYLCKAYNILVNPPAGKIRVPAFWNLGIDVVDYSVDETGLSCSAIPFSTNGLVCASYMYTQSPQYNIFTNHTQIEIDPDSREASASSMLNQIDQHLPDDECRSLAHSIACHSVYPYCDTEPGLPKPRRVCKSACDEFSHGARCSNSAVYSLISPHCTDTPPNAGDSIECIPLMYGSSHQGQATHIEKTGNCMRGNGRGYSGSIFRTTSNLRCQLWEEQYPHRHPMIPEVFTADLLNADDSCRNPGGLGERPWCYTGDKEVRWEYCDIPSCDSCDPYHGKVCANIGNYQNATVMIRRGANINSWQDIEDKLSHMLSRTIVQYQPSDGCIDILTTLLCHMTFPHCTAVDNTKELCNEHCGLSDTLEQFCPGLYEEFKVFSEESSFLSELVCARESDDQCMSLPVIGTDNNSSNEYNCYSGKGEHYRGNHSKTQSGTPCQYWAADVPHPHSTKPRYFPELENGANYCRNPGGIGDRPWCYTSGETLWEYCNIEECDVNDDIVYLDPDGLPNDRLTSGGGSNSSSVAAVISIIIIVALVMAASSVAVGVIMYLRAKRKKLNDIEQQQTAKQFQEKMQYESNSGYIRQKLKEEEAEKLIVPDNFRMLSSKQIKYSSQLGQGNFGVVFKGLAYNIKNDNEEMEVAVKTLKEEASFEVKQSFIDEAKLMFNFDHPNILKIHGVCMDQMPYQMVFEYMDEGDLTQFLRLKASSTQRRLTNPFSYRSRTESSYSNDPASLTKTELLYICKQIASGMTYLSENHHVHRDLACRNCLIKSDLVVKIGDFGMSRNLYTRDYYRVNGHAVLPVRWMSPESLIYGKFSKEGDVWSFGVVMWEVFSFALQPYYGISNEEVTEAIRRGKHLNRPDECPSEVFRLMKDCWNMDPGLRPEFREILDTLSQLHTNSSISEKIESDTSDNTDDDDLDDDDPLSDSLFEHDSEEPDISDTESTFAHN